MPSDEVPRHHQHPPYRLQGFHYGGQTVEHHLGAVPGFRLNYGVETRKQWAIHAHLAWVVLKKSNIPELDMVCLQASP